MNSPPFPWLSLFFLLILFLSHHGSGNPEDLYKSCGKNFTCGTNITAIAYPFRGYNDSMFCGHPIFVLDCNDQTGVTTMEIVGTRYRVLRFDQIKQTMIIVREDVSVGICPNVVNTTLNDSPFEYASVYTNLTFFYGCNGLKPPGVSFPSCGNKHVYVSPGIQGPGGECNASVIVSVPGNITSSGASFNVTGLEQTLRQGVEVRWKIENKVCSHCMESKGRCGYDFITKGTTCFCPQKPYVSKVCKTGMVKFTDYCLQLNISFCGLVLTTDSALELF